MNRVDQGFIVQCAMLVLLYSECARSRCDDGDLRGADWYVQLAENASLAAFAASARTA
ncbi:MAG TPA: hypothetical protein VGN24_03445 [Rhodanobacter sp.]|jgi:hypothetical protein|nr:hypothetical protein [Rhodanobacter sp.]